MAQIIAARFDTFDAAQHAAHVLMAGGITADHLHTFYVNPPGAHDRFPLGGDEAIDPEAGGASMGALTGAALAGACGAALGAGAGYLVGASLVGMLIGMGVGGYVGSLAGAMCMIGTRPRRRRMKPDRTDGPQERRASGVLLAVLVGAEDAQRIGRILRDAGGQEVERAQGRWENGTWKDFDPLEAPTLQKGL